MRYVLIILSLLASFCSPVWADDEAPDLYTARVTVTSRSDDARTAGFQAGLRQVYVKLMAKNDLPSALSSTIPNATQWVDRYQYEQVGDDTYMLVRYNKELVSKALKNADIPFSDQPRPTFVVWLATSIENAPTVLTQQQVSPEAMSMKKALTDAAARLGLRITIPQGDTMDHVTPADINGVFDASIHEASSRYPANGYIAINLTQQDNVWHSTWRAKAGEGNAHGTAEGPLPAALDNTFLLVVAAFENQEEAQPTAPVGAADATVPTTASGLPPSALPAPLSGSHQVSLMVSDVNDLESYMRIDSYLNTLSNVKEVETSEMSMPTVTFHLKINGSIAHLKKMLESGRMLTPDDEDSDDQQPSNTLHYHYENP